ncbi:MAG: cupredoxin domain-containing protein [Actinomycetota bacterium]
MTKPVALMTILLLSVGFMSACNDENDDEAARSVSTTVEAFDFYFDQTTIVLQPSTSATITLINNGDQLHSFTVPDMDVELEAQSAQEVEGTFGVPETPGTYNFYCKFHPDQMKGVITVGGLEEPADPDQDPQPDATETVIVTTPDDDDEDVEVEVEE